MTPTNKDLIRMHLEQYIYETAGNDHYIPMWNEVLAYCSGYYDGVTLEMIQVVRELQTEGKVK